MAVPTQSVAQWPPVTTPQAAPPENRSERGRVIPIVVVVVLVVILAAISTVVFSSSLERGDPSSVIGPDEVPNGVTTQGVITNVDPTKNEMTLRISIRPTGQYDPDGAGIPDRPITMYYDSVDGTKQIDFKAGKPLGTTDLTVPLTNDTISSYPWDSYSAEIGLLFVTTSAPGAVTPSTTTTESADEGGGTSGSASGGSSGGGSGGETPASASSPVNDTVLPSNMIVFKTVPSYSVVEVSGDEHEGVLEAQFSVSRAWTARIFSLLVTLVMWVVAIGVLSVAISVITRRRQMETTLITMMAAIMFALPVALRLSQPGIPPPGVLSDFYGFFWCEAIVASSLASMLLVWLRRGREA